MSTRDVFDDVAEMEPIKDPEEQDPGFVTAEFKGSHWRLDRDTFLEALAPFRAISGTATKNAVTGSVYLPTEKGNLILHGNNKDVYIERTISLENDENILSDAVVVSVTDLDILVRRSPSKVILHRPDEQYLAASLYGSDFYLDVVNVGEFLYDFVDVPADDHFRPLDVEQLTELVSVMSAAMKLAVRPEDRKVIIKDGKAYGSFLLAAVRVKFDGLDGINFRSLDLDFLSYLLRDQETIQFAHSADRIFFMSQGFRFSSMKSDIPVPELIKDLEQTFETVTKSQATLELSELRNVVFVVSKLSNSTNTVTLKTKDGRLYLSYMLKSNKISDFAVGDGVFKEKFQITVDSLRKSLALCPVTSVPSIKLVGGAMILTVGSTEILIGAK